MIRINLLKGRAGAHGASAAGGSAPFLAKWQLWAAVASVLVAVGILAMTLRAPKDEPPPVADPPVADVKPPPKTPISAPPPDEPVEAAAALKPRPKTAAPARNVDPPPSPPAENRPPPNRPSPSAASDGSVNQLARVTATPAGSGLDVFFAIRGEPNFRVIRVDNPSRLAVDIDQARLTIAPQNRASDLDHPLVTKIRIAQNQLDPPRIRAVIEVSSFPSVESRVDAEGITLELRAAAP